MLKTAKINKIARYATIATAVALLIFPDPFSDILALWLLAKIGANFRFLGGTQQQKVRLLKRIL